MRWARPSSCASSLSETLHPKPPVTASARACWPSSRPAGAWRLSISSGGYPTRTRSSKDAATRTVAFDGTRYIRSPDLGLGTRVDGVRGRDHDQIGHVNGPMPPMAPTATPPTVPAAPDGVRSSQPVQAGEQAEVVHGEEGLGRRTRRVTAGSCSDPVWAGTRTKPRRGPASRWEAEPI
jgi:hypothetical protein